MSTYRVGFVSNSSSSSFLLICTKEIYNQSLNELSKLGKNLVKSEYPLGDFSKIKLDGKEYLCDFGEKSSEDFGCDMEDGSDQYEEIEKQNDLFLKNINKNGGVAK